MTALIIVGIIVAALVVGVIIQLVTDKLEDAAGWLLGVILVAPFMLIGYLYRLIKGALERHSAKQQRLPKNFITSAPPQAVGGVLRAEYRKDTAMNIMRATILDDRPGYFRVGVTYSDKVSINFKDGSTGKASGVPIFIFEVHYRPHGTGTHGYFVWTQLPDDDDSEFDEVTMRNLPVWALAPVYDLDPQIELVRHKDARARGLAGEEAVPRHIPSADHDAVFHHDDTPDTPSGGAPQTAAGPGAAPRPAAPAGPVPPNPALAPPMHHPYPVPNQPPRPAAPPRPGAMPPGRDVPGPGHGFPPPARNLAYPAPGHPAAQAGPGHPPPHHRPAHPASVPPVPYRPPVPRPGPPGTPDTTRQIRPR